MQIMLSRKQVALVDRDNFEGPNIGKAIEVVSKKNRGKAQGFYVQTDPDLNEETNHLVLIFITKIS